MLPPYFFNLFHILILAPFFYYIATQKENVDHRVYDILLISVYIMVPYHLYRAYTKIYNI